MEETNQTTEKPAGGTKWLVIGGIVVVAIALFAYLRSQSTSPQAPVTGEEVMVKGSSVEVKFGNHIQMGLPEQDVFVVDPKNESQVWRVEGDANKELDSATQAKTVYASSRAVDHDPFKVGANPLGPFSKGESLGFTLEQWLAATGAGTYTVDGDSAKLSLSFQKLVANGVYTVWCSRLTLPPNVNIVDYPCGAADGSENSFTADASGNGSFTLTLPPLAVSSKETVTVIALAYHSDGKTYGGSPGDFGLVSHVQLAFLMPAPEGQ